MRRRWRVTCFDPGLELPAVEELLAVVGDRGAAARVLPVLGHPPPSGDLPLVGFRGGVRLCFL